MKKILGILIIILSVIGAIYLGVLVMFVGGIIQLIQGIQNNLDAVNIAIGITRILFCEVAAIIPAILVPVGSYLITEE